VQSWDGEPNVPFPFPGVVHVQIFIHAAVQFFPNFGSEHTRLILLLNKIPNFGVLIVFLLL